MSDYDIFNTRFYTTTDGPEDKRVRGGCGHLHQAAGGAVACALKGAGYPVRVDRAGKSVLRMDPALDAALKAALDGAESAPSGPAEAVKKKGGGGNREACRAG